MASSLPIAWTLAIFMAPALPAVMASPLAAFAWNTSSGASCAKIPPMLEPPMPDWLGAVRGNSAQLERTVRLHPASIVDDVLVHVPWYGICGAIPTICVGHDTHVELALADVAPVCSNEAEPHVPASCHSCGGQVNASYGSHLLHGSMPCSSWGTCMLNFSCTMLRAPCDAGIDWQVYLQCRFGYSAPCISYGALCPTPPCKGVDDFQKHPTGVLCEGFGSYATSCACSRSSHLLFLGGGIMPVSMPTRYAMPCATCEPMLLKGGGGDLLVPFSTNVHVTALKLLIFRMRDASSENIAVGASHRKPSARLDRGFVLGESGNTSGQCGDASSNFAPSGMSSTASPSSMLPVDAGECLMRVPASDCEGAKLRAHVGALPLVLPVILPPPVLRR